MASVIPCDMCEERAAVFLVTFTPNGDTVGLGVECVNAWAESTVASFTDAGLDSAQRAAEVFRVSVIPTGDVADFSLDELPAWAEAITRAMDATEAGEEPQAAQEAPEVPRAAKSARARKRAPRGPVEAPPDAKEGEWPVTGRHLRAVEPAATTGTVGEGADVEETAPTAAHDNG